MDHIYNFDSFICNFHGKVICRCNSQYIYIIKMVYIYEYVTLV